MAVSTETRQIVGGYSKLLRVYAIAAVIGLPVLFLQCLLLTQTGAVWDEPPGISRQHAMHNWLFKWVGYSDHRAESYSSRGQIRECDCRSCTGALHVRESGFSEEAIKQGWPFARKAPDEHPPVYAILSYIGWRVTHTLWSPLFAHRLATAVLFSVTASVIFHLLFVRRGIFAAVVGVLSWLCNPRILVHGHLATTDMIMATFWFLCAVSLFRAVDRNGAGWWTGFWYGLGLMSKLTAALAIVPLFLWSWLYHRWALWKSLSQMLVVVPCVMVAAHPAWWPIGEHAWLRPISGVYQWFLAVTDYPQHVPVYFLGKLYDYQRSFLPWFNAWLLVAVTIPVGLLFFALGGALCGFMSIGRALSLQFRKIPFKATDHDTLAVWALMNGFALLLVRAFGWMPGHDGLRQLVAVFPFFSVLVALGADALCSRRLLKIEWKWVKKYLKTGMVQPDRLFTGILLLGAMYQCLLSYPLGLSYYNTVSGGTDGARSLGMETTYYWDAVGPTVIDWLNRSLPPDSTLVIAPPPDVRTFRWLQRWGQLREDVQLQQYTSWLRTASTDVYLVVLSREGLIYTYPLLDRFYGAKAEYELDVPGTQIRALAILSPRQLQKLLP